MSEELNLDVQAEPAAGTPEAPAPARAEVKRGAEFRRSLVRKLPQLVYHELDTDAALELHHALDGLVTLDADAFLEPLRDMGAKERA